MATFYIDMINGSDAADGTTWGTAWKTVNSGSTAVRIAPGDIIKVAKSGDKSSLGDGTWTSVAESTQPNTTYSISGATNATPIEITAASGGSWVTGDVVSINSVGGNTAANGIWIITNTGTNTFTLDGSAGNGTYTSGGTAQNINFRSVKLASNTSTKLVSDCNTNWTAVGNPVVTADTSFVKTTPQGVTITNGGGTAQDTLLAYMALPGGAQDFSAYTALTFWLRVGTALTTSTRFRLCLCSDTEGTTIVDSFNLPAVGSNNQLNSLVVTKTGGGNLGSSIQSVALYSGSSAVNNVAITLDNINGCTPTGLNLQSVISPVASNTDIYDNYPIAGIVNNIILLDNAYLSTNLNTTGLRGYYSDTLNGTITTYYRNAIDYAGVNSLSYATISGAMGDCTENGTQTAITTWSGGWNTSTDVQEGVTLVYIPAASVGWTPKDYNKVEWMGILRGLRGFGQNNLQARTFSGWNISNCFSSGASVGYLSQGSSILTGELYPNTIANFGANNAGTPGFTSAFQQINADTIKLKNCHIATPGVASAGAFINSGALCVFKNTEVYNSAQAAISSTPPSTIFYNTTAKLNAGLTYTNGTTYFNTVTTAGNSFIFYVPISGNPDGGNQYISDITYTESNIYSNTKFALGNSYMSGLNGVANNFLGYTHQAEISRETTITHSGASSWRVNVLNMPRNEANPVAINFGQIYLKANVAATISIWVYLENNQVNANLALVGYQIPGVNSNVVATADQGITGTWQQLSMTVTPTENGVVTLQANAWLNQGAANKSVYFDDISVPLGINTSPMEQPYFGLPYVQNAAAPSVAYAAVGL